MKKPLIVHTLIVAVGLGLFAAGCATSQQQLAAQAKITRSQAEQTALAQVPGGKITEGELERERGQLIWSFDITSPGAKDITEIHVDAITGQVISRETETPAQQAKEAKEKQPKRP